jgi:hypothetical protein
MTSVGVRMEFGDLKPTGAGGVLLWLATVIAGIVGGAWTSRANIMGAVNARVESLLGHLEAEIARATAAHQACEERVTRVVQRLNDVEGELRQTKQTLESVERMK